MKKLLLLVVTLSLVSASQAQISLFNKKKKKKEAADTAAVQPVVQKQQADVINAPKVKKDWSKVSLANRAADHFMIQYGADVWTNRPDSVRTSGFSRHFNFYVMLDKPFKANPRYSIAYGLGIGSSNMFFDKVNVNLTANGPTLPFTDVSSSNHFNKYKLTTIYLELPLELRFYSDPENTGKSWKFAIGAKVGTLLKSYTKGKDYQNAAGVSQYGTSYVEKRSNKRYMNGTKLAVSTRIGYGIFSLHGEYNILGVIKDGFGPAMNAYSIGLSISGL